MRILVPVLLVLAQVGVAFAQVDVGGPTQTQDPNYPLQVLILGRNTSHGYYGGWHVWGRADLFTGQQEQGFDYESDCGRLFMVSHGDERYSARWKKPNEQLEMLVSKIGTGKSDKCVLKADMKPFVYEYDHGSEGHTVTRPMRNPAPAVTPAPATTPQK
ncbi:MAG: hypothetical protein WBE97_02485 [Candidatus Acidiferrales bacterium]